MNSELFNNLNWLAYENNKKDKIFKRIKEYFLVFSEELYKFIFKSINLVYKNYKYCEYYSEFEDHLYWVFDKELERFDNQMELIKIIGRSFECFINDEYIPNNDMDNFEFKEVLLSFLMEEMNLTKIDEYFEKEF